MLAVTACVVCGYNAVGDDKPNCVFDHRCVRSAVAEEDFAPVYVAFVAERGKSPQRGADCRQAIDQRLAGGEVALPVNTVIAEKAALCDLKSPTAANIDCNIRGPYAITNLESRSSF